MGKKPPINKDMPTAKKNIDARNCQADLKQKPQVGVEDCSDMIEGGVLAKGVLPPGIVEIDLKDQDNPQLCAEYASSMYAYLRNVEKGLVIQKDFLRGCCINGSMGYLFDETGSSWLVLLPCLLPVR